MRSWLPMWDVNMESMNNRKKAELTACSDPLSADLVPEICALKELLCGEGLDTEMISGFFDRGVDVRG